MSYKKFVEDTEQANVNISTYNKEKNIYIYI